MTPRFYRVGPAIWDQPWDDDTRLVALYLLTNPHRTTEGLYRLPLAYATADLRWKAGRVERALEVLIASDFVRYDVQAQVVWIVKALAWQSPTNPNQVKGAARVLRGLPATTLFEDFLRVCEAECPQLYRELAGSGSNRGSDPGSKAGSNHGSKAGSTGVDKPVSNTPSPSPTPSSTPPNPPRGELRPGHLAEVPAPPKAKPLRFGGRPVSEKTRAVAIGILDEFNQVAGTSYKPLDGRDLPTDSLRRIFGALLAHPEITLDRGKRMISVAFADPYWTGKPTLGVVFGPGVVERYLEMTTDGGGGVLSMEEYAERLNRGLGA